MSEKYLPAELLKVENVRQLSYPISQEEYDKMYKQKPIFFVPEDSSTSDESNIVDVSFDIDNTSEKIEMHIIGILVDGKFHEYEKPNYFLSEPTILLDDYMIESVTNTRIAQCVIGEVYEPPICTCDMNNPKTYLTEDNYSKAYKVEIIDDKIVKIYTCPKKIISTEISCESCLLSEFLVQYEAEKIFIGKSMLNSMTEFSGGHGDKWDGNS